VVGGAVGAALLLSTPAQGFERVVPILLALASAAILLRVRAVRKRESLTTTTYGQGAVRGRQRYSRSASTAVTSARRPACCSAMLLRTGGATLAHANAGKNVILGVANVVAAVIFAIFAPVQWWAVIPLGLAAWSGLGWALSWSATRPPERSAW